MSLGVAVRPENKPSELGPVDTGVGSGSSFFQYFGRTAISSEAVISNARETDDVRYENPRPLARLGGLRPQRLDPGMDCSTSIVHWSLGCPFHKLELYEIGELPVLPPLSVGEMTLRLRCIKLQPK